MNGTLHERLDSLKHIRPDAAFLARGRAELMDAITPRPRRVRLASFVTALRMPLATAVLSLIALVAAHQAPTAAPAGTAVVASLDANAIRAEQLAANATGSVPDAAYFKDVSPAVSLALTDIADPAVNWDSGTKIQQALAFLAKND